MGIPRSCVEAASVRNDLTKNGWAKDTDEARARRVILALAEETATAEAVGDACRAYLKQSGSHPDKVRAAIAAFLKHVAGDTP